VLHQILHELIADDGRDDLADFGVAKFGLGLAFILRVRVFHRDDAGQTFAAIVGREVRLFVFEEFELMGVIIDRPVEGEVKALDVGAAFLGAEMLLQKE
jgi:hypothetical protein